MRSHLGIAVLLTAALSAQDRARNAALHLAYVGNLTSDRGQDFVRFLREQFPRVDAVERATCTPDKLRFVDVVILDWPQSEGVMKWVQNPKQERTNPLGDLQRWDRPTVLIGSAGLNLAAGWGLPGSHG